MDRDVSFPFLATPAIQAQLKKKGDSLREIKTIDYTCGLSVVIVGLGLYSYYVRELLASLVLFTGTFLLGLVLGCF